MSDFQVSITDPITSEPDITIADNVITIEDNSNYADGTEAGHDRSDFADFYKLILTFPSGDIYTYSSLGDGDESIDTPDAGDPDIAYTYDTGDGQYFVTIYVVPTYNASAAYLITKTPYVYYNSKIWKLKQNATGQTPAEGVYWTEVEETDLPSKYTLTQRFVITDDAMKGFARRVYNANCVNLKIGDNWETLFRDPEYIDAVRIYLGLAAIPIQLAGSLYDDIDNTLNMIRTLNAKY